MAEININSLSKFEMMRRLKLTPSQAERVVVERARKPFDRKDFDSRMKNDLPDEVRARILKEGLGHGSDQPAGLRSQFIAAVDRYADLVTALPAGEQVVTAMRGLKLAARRLTPGMEDPEDPDVARIAWALLDRLEFNLELLEEATLRALAGRLTVKSAYRRILTLPRKPGWQELLLSGDLADELAMLELAGAAGLEIGDQKSDGKTILQTLLDLGARNKKEIAKLLALLAKGLDQAWIEYIIRVLEVANDIGLFDPKKLAKDKEQGGTTADCYATVFMTGVRSSGGDVGDNWTLYFKVDGEEVSHQLDFGQSYDTNPLLLRARYKIGPCGQVNPVKVMFWAKERETLETEDLTLPGDVGFEVFDSPCPSQQEKEILTLVYEDSNNTKTSEELHAKVVVLKDCGDVDIGMPAM